MTRPLRRAHRRVWLLLAVLLPALYVAALAARRTTTPPNPDIVWERLK
jgi:hypothetical protein